MDVRVGRDFDWMVVMKLQRGVRPAVRTQWMVLGGALVVLAGVLVTWALSTAAGRVQVVRLAHDVPAGHTLTIDDLALTDVAFDAPVAGLVPGRSLHELVGRVVAVDLPTGALLQKGTWRESPVLAADERAVGATLKVGRMPSGLAVGDAALAAPMQPGDATPPATVRVLTLDHLKDGSVSVSLAVPADVAVVVAQLAATDQLVLIGNGTGNRNGSGS
jgi:hypothetical protein